MTTTSAYDGEDVKRQLLADQRNKCYICERVCETDFEIEHHKSKTNYPHLVQDWNNLFMGCGYCNRKKSSRFDDILNPKDCNIEEEIEQRIDFANNKALFHSKVDTMQHHTTVELLNKVFNGSKCIRKVKEEYFFERVLSVVNKFLDLVCRYQNNPTSETEKAVKDELAVDKEMLGFKYWIIIDNPRLYAVFAKDIVWHK